MVPPPSILPLLSSTSPSTKFKVKRSEPKLIVPAKPTANELKELSDLDKEEALKMFVPTVLFYSHNPSMEGRDPVKVLREALEQTLVFFYPLAGRLRQWPGREILVECNGEGVVFVEAEADTSLRNLSEIGPFHPPFSYLDEIIYNLHCEDNILDSPLLHVQITRLKCGGFIVGTHVCHHLCDGIGFAQFLSTWGEISQFHINQSQQLVAQSIFIPSISPVWQRDLLCARDPPKITFSHPEMENTTLRQPLPISNKTYRSFHFTQSEISALRHLIRPEFRSRVTSFELITACLWRCRTVALQLTNPNEEVRMIFAVNVRTVYNPPLKGYYGNAIAYAGALTTAGKICDDDVKISFEHALDHIKKARKNVNEKYMKSFIDLLAVKGHPRMPVLMTSFFVSDLRRIGVREADFGWGKAVYGGPGVAWYEPYPWLEAYYLHVQNSEGEDVFLVPMCLPYSAMEIFSKEIYDMLKIVRTDHTPSHSKL